MTEHLVNHQSVPLPTAARNAIRAYWERRECDDMTAADRKTARNLAYRPNPNALFRAERAVRHCREIGVDPIEPGAAFASALWGTPWRELRPEFRRAFAAAEREALRGGTA